MTEAEEVLLRFEPLSASLLVRHGRDPTQPRGIQFAVRPSDSIEFSNGTSLNEHEWNIVVDVGEPYSPRAREVGALGLMHGPFGKEEDFRAGLIGCAVDQQAFETLLQAILAGRLPRNITVTVVSAGVVTGPEHGRAIWDPKEDRSPPVVKIDFYTPLVESTATKDEADSGESQNSATALASRGDIQALARTVRETLLAGQAQVRAIAIGAAVFVLILLFLRH